jgi:hypothetical protein
VLAAGLAFTVAGCGSDAGGGGGSSVPAPGPELSSDSTDSSDSEVTATGGTIVSGSAVPTTVGDLLTEAEVAEIEQALDDLEGLLDEIDADLADVADP